MFAGGRDDRDSDPIAVFAMMIQMAISRSREFAANAGASRIIGNPRAPVAALRRIDAIARRVPLDANPTTAHMFIVKPYSGQDLLSLFSTHPPTEARIQALSVGLPGTWQSTPWVAPATPPARRRLPPSSGQSTT
jgi:heat shock protein HtpX